MAGEKSEPQRVLTEEILADAKRQADRALKRAKREADDIHRKAEADADADRGRRLADAEADAARRRDLVLATVPVEVGRLQAARVESVLESVHDEARRRLAARDGFDYRGALAALAGEAVARMGGRAFVLELSEADRQAFGAGLADDVRRRLGRSDLEITVAPQGAAIGGGVIVRGADGRELWDNSFEGRLGRLWPVFRREIGARTSLAGERPADKES